MSEWFQLKDADNVDLSGDGKFFHILFQTNRNGNRIMPESLTRPKDYTLRLAAHHFKVGSSLPE